MSKRQKSDQNELFSSLAKDFHELVSSKQQLRSSAEHFLNNIIDEITVGIIFDIHRKIKTDAFDLEANDSEEEDANDIFLQHNLKKNQDCVCPNCSRTVAAARFAPHLEACMGMRKSRSVSRRVAANNNNHNKDRDRESQSFPGVPSDDENDDDWGSEKKRNRKKDKNGGKKNRGTPKKSFELEPIEAVNVDIEGDDEELSNFRDMMHIQDQHSNSSSPAEGASTANKKKEKSKKKSKKDRNSPCTSMSVD